MLNENLVNNLNADDVDESHSYQGFNFPGLDGDNDPEQGVRSSTTSGQFKTTSQAHPFAAGASGSLLNAVNSGTRQGFNTQGSSSGTRDFQIPSYNFPTPAQQNEIGHDAYELQNPLTKREYTISGLSVASLLLLFSSSIAGSVYGIITGLVSLLAAVVLWLYIYYPYNIISQQVPAGSTVYFAYFFFVWWTLAFVILTFTSSKSRSSSHFAQLSNGFMSLWMGFLLSIGLMYQELQIAKNLAGKIQKIYANSKAIGLLAVVSGVELMAASSICLSESCSGTKGFAISLGLVSVLICVGLIYNGNAFERSSGMASYLVGFLCAWWLLGVVVCTFKGPFVDEYSAVTSLNGFAATWAALFASGWLYAAAQASM